MKLHYYPETDSFYIELKDTLGTKTREIVQGLNVDLDANCKVVGFDIDHARASATCRRSKPSLFHLRARRSDWLNR